VHPYPNSLSPDLFETSMNEVRAVRNAHGDVNRPIWVTELGLTTSGPQSQGGMTEQDQAAGVVKYLRLLEAMPDVRAIIFHTLVEPRGWRGTSGPGYGVVRRDLAPKPAYCALAHALQASPPSC
jgi:GH35 family endo-1,4-beta-xylanase